MGKLMQYYAKFAVKKMQSFSTWCCFEIIIRGITYNTRNTKQVLLHRAKIHVHLIILAMNSDNAVSELTIIGCF